MTLAASMERAATRRFSAEMRAASQAASIGEFAEALVAVGDIAYLDYYGVRVRDVRHLTNKLNPYYTGKMSLTG